MGGPDATVLEWLWRLCLRLVRGVLVQLSGSMIAYFGVPSFVASLGMMMVASGLAYMISGALFIRYRIPLTGWGVEILFGIPNAVVLMILLYLAAHFLMGRTTAGRYVYAVGGNARGGEAFRCAG